MTGMFAEAQELVELVLRQVGEEVVGKALVCCSKAHLLAAEQH